MAQCNVSMLEHLGQAISAPSTTPRMEYPQWLQWLDLDLDLQWLQWWMTFSQVVWLIGLWLVSASQK
eukprot:1161188-Pelagomonas_calceolata.AAC.1